MKSYKIVGITNENRSILLKISISAILTVAVGIIVFNIFTGESISTITQTAAVDKKAIDAMPSRSGVPGSIIMFSEQKEAQYAILVEKSTQSVFLYSDQGGIKEVVRTDGSTGENKGDKQVRGDRKTPEGVYFFTTEHEKRDLGAIYGTRAFPMDYPNAHDRFLGKTGGGIWMHGTNKPLKARDSNGCVALNNEDIDYLDTFIRLHWTPIIVEEKIDFISRKKLLKNREVILNIINGWLNALEKGTYHEYLNFYSPEYLPDMEFWSTWVKRFRGEKDTDKPALVRENTAIYRANDMVVAILDQYIEKEKKNKFVGRYKLFMKEKNQAYKIISEEYLLPTVTGKPGRIYGHKENTVHPLIAALDDFRKKTTPVVVARHDPAVKREIVSVVDDWLKAWSSKDIQSYSDYYSKDFFSQGKNKNAWVQYKASLNNKYKVIRVAQTDLRVKTGGDRSSATFIQNYQNDVFKNKGIKTLQFKRENGKWKIYRESWQKK